MPSNELAPGPVHLTMAERARRSGVRRIHVFAFRDIDAEDAGGSELHAREVCTHLARAGLEVTHHTARVPGLPEEIERDGVRVVRRGGQVGVFARSVLDERSGRLGPCDAIVEIFHGLPFFAPLWARRVPQVGLVHHVHLGTWHHLLPQPAASVGHALERFLVPRVYRRRHVVTVAESTRQEVATHYGIDPDHIRVVLNGVDERFSPGGQRDANPLVLAVTRLMPQKGVPDLLEAMARVHEAMPAARLVIVGDGPERPAIERQVELLGLAGAVELAGYASSDALVDWYRRAWVVASASLREGFGLTLTEAAACGTPQVARRIPGHSDAVRDGVTGLLADGVVGMADALVRVLTDDALRTALGQAAAEWAGSLRWEDTASGILDAVCDAVDRQA